MTPSRSSDPQNTPFALDSNIDSPSTTLGMQDSTFGVQSLHSSVTVSESSPLQGEVEMEGLGAGEGKDLGESRRLEDALRAAMMMSGHLGQDQAHTDPQEEGQSRGTCAASAPVTPIRHSTFFESPSRSSSPSVSTSSISLSLSTPASPVSLSSVPESMALSMDLGSSTTWSLSAESRSGSPSSIPERRTGGPTTRNASHQDARSSGMSESPSRPLHPYAISRRNTATIPQIIRSATANSDTRQADAHASATYSGSFQSDTTTQDIHSRSHWAVQESVERQRYQGDLFELVLPVLELPAASVTTATSASRETVQHNTERSQAIPRTSNSAISPSRDDSRNASVISIALCGTNRTTNIFLRELMQDPRFEIYKLPNPTSAQSADPARSRSRHGNGKTAAKEAYYTVGVYAVDVATPSGIPADAAAGRRLVGKINVFGRGQQGNLERALAHIKHTYSRLDSLLRPPPPADEKDEGSLGSSDMHSLVESWLWSRPAASDTTSDLNSPEWCELAILTGDGRHLLGEGKSISIILPVPFALTAFPIIERALMEELVSTVPTVCHPEDLGSLLSLACELDFHVPEAQHSEARMSHRSRADFSTRRFLDWLLDISGTDQVAHEARRKLRKSSIRSFMRWRSLDSQRSLASTVTGSRVDGSDQAAARSMRAVDRARPDRRRSGLTPERELRPTPTLTRARASMEGQPGDWEAGLSRRAALRRDATEERPGSSAPVATPSSPKKSKDREKSGFFDDRSCVGKGYNARSGLGVTDGFKAGWSIVQAFVHPLRVAQTMLWPETLPGGKGMGKWGWFKVACLGAVVGLAGLWLAKSA